MNERLQYVTKQCKITKHTVLETVKGEALCGTEYQPLFNYFIDKKASKCFTVIGANYVSTDAGTGIVHQSPGFGDDDYQACIANGLIEPGKAPVPID